MRRRQRRQHRRQLRLRLLRRLRRPNRPLVVAAWALCALAPLVAACQLAPASPASRRPNAAPQPGVEPPAPVAEAGVALQVYGDSLVWQAARPLRFFGALRGWKVEVAAIGGVAPCDLVGLAQDRAATPPVPRRVVMAFAGNALTPCMAGVSAQHAPGPADPALLDKYEADLSTMAQSFEAAGSQVYLALPTPGNPARDRLGERYRAMAAHDLGLRLIDPAALLAPDGQFSLFAACLPAEPGCHEGQVRLHSEQDWLHFWCPQPGPYAVDGQDCRGWDAGAIRFALALLPPKSAHQERKSS